jgi:alkanesulfonate monooxygenase SsuD/methylene tetrahydromethanopterin reductase-like flavin-dependent oxidoreductase (luciferase family)
MKLGLILAVRNHPAFPRPLSDVYAENIEDAVYAETELGFDHVWVNEHHLQPDQYSPSPWMVLSAIAVQTTAIRLGPSVICLPMHHPVSVSENAAVLDVLSNGRLELGLGIGSSEHEYRTFGSERSDAWKQAFEAARLIERTFKEGEFDFHGDFYELTEVTQTTKPLQENVRIWWGGAAPQTARRAARRGYNIMATGTRVYDEALLEFGRSPDEHEVGQVIGIHLAETRERAWDEAQHGIRWWMEFHRLRTGAPAGMTPEGPLPELPPAERLRDVEGLFFLPGMPVCVGTPDEVLPTLLAAYGGEHGRITQFAFHMRHPGMRTPEIRRSMELFRTEVMPRLRRKPQLSAAGA